MTHDDSGPVTFVDMVLVLLENQFPWLAAKPQNSIGADTIDQLIKLRALLLRQPRHVEGTRLPHAPKEGLHNDQLATSPGLLIVLSEKVAKEAARNEK